MKIKILTLLFSSVLIINSNVFSEEGMWLPFLINELNYADMVNKGLKLSQEQLYDINHASLKDAIVMLDYGNCTGEIISNEGLLLTNHHCGYGEIQAHSTIDNDYLTNGFVAWNRSDELANPGKTASFLERIEDVTDIILNNINPKMTETERTQEIQRVADSMVSMATQNTLFNASVESMFEGNEFYLFVYTTYKDVRLVFAPPSSIGKFGGDTDNWMWPRHTGDFSMFRIYTAPDGTPTDYSDENIPLKPKYYLPISLDGIKKDDFAMIWGYPGSTDRYLTSFGVQYTLEHFNPDLINLMGKVLDIMKTDMDQSNDVRIKYASTYARIANYWKYLKGQNRGLKRLKIYDQKVLIEKEFSDWLDENQNSKSLYKNILTDFEESYNQYTENAFSSTYLYYRIAMMATQTFKFASQGMGLYKSLKSGEGVIEKVEDYQTLLDANYMNYNETTDEKLLAVFLETYFNVIPSKYQPDIYEYIKTKFKGDYNKYAKYCYEKSVFSSLEKMEAFLAKPNSKILDKDPIFKTYRSFGIAFQKMSSEKQKLDIKLDKTKRLFIAGLREMKPDAKYYPDANSTMRVTYGSVEDYYPADAIHYDYITYMKGILEKEDPSNDEFIVPEKLERLYNNRDFGKYSADGKMPVCFLTTNDITGGNSGSPVINGNGELIGTAFDGNWEAMSGDIAFEPELQRTIVADIRYILFIIDKFANATHLVEEMTLVKKASLMPTEDVPAEIN